MSELSTEQIVSTAQGVMPGVEPANPRSNVIPQAPQRVNQPDNRHDQVFTADDIERARQQEKDKVYGKVEDLTSRLRVFEEEREERVRSEQERQAQAQAEAERQRREETDLRTLLEQQQADFAAQLAAERAERERALALLDKEQQFSALVQYKNDQVRTYEEQILPELLDEVSGNTPDEIDASIARLVGKTESILNNVGAVVQTQRQTQAGPRVTAPPVGPLETESAQQQLSATDIANMSMTEYQQRRGQLGVTGGRSNRGLFD